MLDLCSHERANSIASMSLQSLHLYSTVYRLVTLKMAEGAELTPSSHHLEQVWELQAQCLGALATNAAGQLDVLGHDCHALGVDSSKVGVLKQAYQICLCSLLQSQDGAALEAKVGLKVLSNLAHQALEGQLADQQLRTLLVLSNLTQSHGTRAVPKEQEKRVADAAT